MTQSLRRSSAAAFLAARWSDGVAGMMTNWPLGQRMARCLPRCSLVSPCLLSSLRNLVVVISRTLRVLPGGGTRPAGGLTPHRCRMSDTVSSVERVRFASDSQVSARTLSLVPVVSPIYRRRFAVHGAALILAALVCERPGSGSHPVHPSALTIGGGALAPMA